MKSEPSLPLQRVIGVLLTIGGLWHAAAPWTFGYSGIRSALISDLASGLALALVGVTMVAIQGAAWLYGIGAAIGVWVLVSPQLLGNAGPRMVMLEAIWGGPLTIILIVLAALERQFDRIGGYRPAEGREGGAAMV
jgi:hypothetical protein